MMRLALTSLALAAAAFSMPAHALEKPTRIQNLAGDMVVKYASDRGIPRADPRVFNTLKGLSTSLAKNATYIATGAAVGVGAAATSPSWGSILLMLAIGVGLDYAIDIAADGSYKLLFQNGAVVAIAPPEIGAEFLYFPGGLNKDNYTGRCSMTLVTDLCMSAAHPEGGYQAPAIERYPITCMYPGQANPTIKCLDPNSGIKTFQEAYKDTGLASEVSEGTKKQYQFIGDAFADMPNDIKMKPISPEALSIIFDKGLQQAAGEPGYDGIPYNPAKPVTGNDVKTLPSFAEPPLVGDFFAPQPDPATSFSPAVPAGGGTTASPTAPPVAVTPDATNPDAIKPQEGSTKVDLGPDPVIGTPNLEQTPTVPMILDPIMNMLPSFKSFAMPSHSTVCPRPTFDFFGHTMTITSHCEIAEKNRSTIFGFMLAVFAIAGVTIVLKA